MRIYFQKQLWQCFLCYEHFQYITYNLWWTFTLQMIKYASESQALYVNSSSDEICYILTLVLTFSPQPLRVHLHIFLHQIWHQEKCYKWHLSCLGRQAENKNKGKTVLRPSTKHHGEHNNFFKFIFYVCSSNSVFYFHVLPLYIEYYYINRKITMTY